MPQYHIQLHLTSPFSYSVQDTSCCPTWTHNRAVSDCSNHWGLCGRDSLWCSGHTASGGNSDGSSQDSKKRNRQRVRTHSGFPWYIPLTTLYTLWDQYIYMNIPCTHLYIAGSNLLQLMPAPVLLLMQYQWTPTPPMRRCMCTSTLTRKTPSSEWGANVWELCFTFEQTCTYYW